MKNKTLKLIKREMPPIVSNDNHEEILKPIPPKEDPILTPLPRGSFWIWPCKGFKAVKKRCWGVRILIRRKKRGCRRILLRSRRSFSCCLRFMKRCVGRCKKNRLFSLLALAVMASACSTSSETFDSEPGPGVGAHSITKVNKMIDAGSLKGIDTEDDPQKIYPPVFLDASFNEPTIEGIRLSDKTILQRQSEKHVRVWIAPFQDLSGNFHEGSLIHTLLHQGYWQISPNPYYS